MQTQASVTLECPVCGTTRTLVAATELPIRVSRIITPCPACPGHGRVLARFMQSGQTVQAAPARGTMPTPALQAQTERPRLG